MNKNTLRIFFGGEFNEATTSACIDGASFLLQKGKYQDLEIYLDSNGGEVAYTEKLAYFFKDFEMPITTWNTGSVGSSTHILYSLGNPRYVDMGGVFFFHKATTLSLPDDLQIAQNVWDYREYAEQQQTRYIAQIISDNITNTNLNKQTILTWMISGRRLEAQGALNLGYAHEIRSPVPLNALNDFCWIENNLAFASSQGKIYNRLLGNKPYAPADFPKI